MSEKKSSIPSEVVAVVRAARELVKARAELRTATEDQAGDAALKRRRDTFRKRLDALEESVVALDKRLSVLRKRAVERGQGAAAQPFDWSAVFGLAGRVVEAVAAGRGARGAASSTEGARGGDVIDAEIIG